MSWYLIANLNWKYFSFHWPYIWQVYKTAVTHYFSMEKARIHLGYNPQKYTLDGVIQHFKKTGHGRPQRPPSRLSYHLVNILLGIMIACLILSCLPTVTTCSMSLITCHEGNMERCWCILFSWLYGSAMHKAMFEKYLTASKETCSVV